MTDRTASLLERSIAIEAQLVARNDRGMALVRSALAPGYCLRAARLLTDAPGPVLICTGFPVANTFETDGPAGALALYQFCESRGQEPWIVAGEILTSALGSSVRSISLDTFDAGLAERDARSVLDSLKPGLIIAVERPGAADDGRYYNIRSIDITEACRPAEAYVTLATCPVIGIGDGGNELGMGKAGAVLEQLKIRPAVVGCDELIVADVSNWGAYALIALAEALNDDPVLSWLDPSPLLARLVELGAVDGVTHEATATEDGLEPFAHVSVIEGIRSTLMEEAAK